MKHDSAALYKTVFIVAFALSSIASVAQSATDSTKAAAKPEVAKKWYETISLRGYTQLRYNRLLETNPELGCEQCDRSWGKGGGFFFRRGRMIFSGEVNDNVAIYIQFDFAAQPTSTSALHFVQLRDAYFDYSFDKKKEFRIRFGQSKVPFGYENLQSSQNRLPLDRGDALNSAVANERDIGAFFYWAPEGKRKLYRELSQVGGKGSGDYGVFGLGIYNGQIANATERNDQVHVVSRLSYPFEYKEQILEVGVQGYAGRYVVPTDNITSGVATTDDREYDDQRVAGSIVLQPRPFGILAEYNVGKGPEYNAATDSIETQSLEGGSITLSYRIKSGKQVFYPFVNAHYYDGGKKQERDARSYKVNEYQAGVEWQISKNAELVATYVWSYRRYEDFRTEGNYQEGRLLRIQFQFNY